MWCRACDVLWCFFFFQAEDGIRDLVRSRGLGDVYKRQPAHIAARKDYFDWLAGHIQIPGLIGVTRATDFDDTSYRNGGIVLNLSLIHI